MITAVQRETTSPVQTSDGLRVLHLHSGNMMGGIESVLITIAENANSCCGFAQEIALAFEGVFSERLREAGMKVHRIASAQLRNPLSILRSRRDLQALLATNKFDAVISHSPWCQAIYGPVLKASQVPVVMWMHGAFDGHWLQKLAGSHTPDFVICNSEYTRSTLKVVYPRVESAVIHYPVKPLVFSSNREAVRRSLGVAQNKVVILMASRMEHWKGHFNLIHAATQISSANDWEIWIAGAAQTKSETEYYRTVVAEVRRSGLENCVRFLGQRNDVADLMCAADIFCQPNAAPEPFGVVFVEALQAGIPVVTFDMGGPHEILETSDFLVHPGDTAGVGKALARLIDDSQLREQFRRAGPARATALCDAAQQIQGVRDCVRTVVRSAKGAVD